MWVQGGTLQTGVQLPANAEHNKIRGSKLLGMGWRFGPSPKVLVK